MHTAGLASATLRVADALAGSETSGVVALSVDRIEIAAATLNARKELSWLVAHGWLVVDREPERRVSRTDPDLWWWTPRRYQITLPEIPQLAQTPVGDRLGWVSLSASWATCLPGHDCFRRVTGSLGASYPLLALLGEQPTPLPVLAGWLAVPKRRLDLWVRSLVAAGVAADKVGGVALAARWAGRLDEVAKACGTAGARQRALERYDDKCQALDEWRSDHNVIGTPSWRREQRREFVVSGVADDVVDVVVGCYERALTVPDVALAVWLAEQ
jgi:hypothetical protein